VDSVRLLINDLSAGELSPKMEGAVNHPLYPRGARKMENAFPSSISGFRRMPGSYYEGAARGAGPARLVFYSAPGGSYMVELTHFAARFWKTDHTGLVMDGGATFELVTPYNEAYLFELQVAEIKGRLWIVHHLYAPRYIEELGPLFQLVTPIFSGARTFAAPGAYPSAIDYFSGRLGLADTDDEPNVAFYSRTPVAATGADRLTDFTLGANPDDAIIVPGSTSRIRWLISHRRVLAGGERNTLISPSTLATPGTFYFDVNGYSGCAPIQPVALGSLVFFIGEPATSLHALSYSQEAGGYGSMDLTRYSEHILKPGVKELVAITRPQNMLFAVRMDGQLVSCTIDIGPDGLSYGWARHRPAAGGLVESAAVSPGTDADELWRIVNRGGTRTVEYSKILEDDDFQELHYLDCGLRLECNPPAATIGGLAHLEGLEVAAIGDGANLPRRTVVGGEVTFDEPVSLIHIGLPYRSTVQTMRPEVPLSTTWQGKTKKVEEVTVRLHRSFAGKGGWDETHLFPIRYLVLGQYELGEPPAPFTGDKTLTLSGDVNTDGAVVLVADEPFPFTVLAIMSRIAAAEV
jgi:hypothetical protein